MTPIGQRVSTLLARPTSTLGWIFLGVLAALLPALWLFDFTVDDALISVRYARNVASGAGYRFNATGPATDGVTPLPWPFLLAPFARGDALHTLVLAKRLGLGAWLVAAGFLGRRIGACDAHSLVKASALLVLGACVPVAANAVSGMETGLAMALATIAATLVARPWVAASLAGLAASLRPELAPWSVVLAFAFARPGYVRLLAAVVAATPLLACTVARTFAFGAPYPLALLAKPSDFEHGVTYVVAASLAALTPILAFAPVATVRSGVEARGLGLAAVAHVAAVIAVGGDWMPFARLVAPVAPSLLLSFVLTSRRAHVAATSVRVAATAVVAAYIAVGPATRGRNVGRDRAELVAVAAPLLAGARRVAALDVGWVSAATGSTIIDLAGLTDPDIAALPGGHTSKRVDAAMLLGFAPDALLLLASHPVDPSTPDAWKHARYARVVEARLAASPLLWDHFRPRAFFPLTTGGYVLLERVR